MLKLTAAPRLPVATRLLTTRARLRQPCRRTCAVGSTTTRRWRRPVRLGAAHAAVVTRPLEAARQGIRRTHEVATRAALPLRNDHLVAESETTSARAAENEKKVARPRFGNYKLHASKEQL